MIHRDIMIRNFMVSRQVQPVLATFNKVRFVSRKKPWYKLTPTDTILWGWSAPEVFLEGIHGKPSDVWMFGITLYELFFGKTVGGLHGDESGNSSPFLPYGKKVQNSEDLKKLFVETSAKSSYERLFDFGDPDSEKAAASSKEVLDIVKNCCNHEPEQRPTMKSLVANLSQLSVTHGETRSLANVQENVNNTFQFYYGFQLVA
eukprot:TRINITY_DN1312_c0_g1_i1.p1 TRINITY_DN1312_c0_g1~~TRINITY_DN1312_c0_g1_i1.p1  ORF type:complete len:203 (-),score=26.98 TRINITY_DN1312_c0_g1_i1:74-682(-)